MTRAKAYSYIRFSTPAQAEGDSLRRQTSAAAEYAARHGLDLQDVSYRDLGVSAYYGDNAETGHLAEFIDAVRLGVIPSGSYLLIESLDRLSRTVPRRATRLLEDICDLGITVVTLDDQRRYTAKDIDEEPMTLMVALMVSIRAHEESKRKGQRVRAAWANKKANAGSTKLTKRAPSWLRLNEDRRGFTILENKADIVRRVYRMAAEGVGPNVIAKTLNLEGVATLNGAMHWHKSSVIKLIRSETTIGTYVPHSVEREGNRRVRRPHPPVRGYYPAIIDEDLWQQVRLATARGAAVKGRAAATGVIHNILSGLVKCDLCGGSMVYVMKSERDRYLVCQRAKMGAGCQYRSVRYADVEFCIVNHLNPRAMIAEFASNAQLGEDLNAVEAEISVLRDAIDRLRGTKSATMRETVADYDAALLEAEARRERIEDAIEESEPAIVMARVDALSDVLATEPLDRTKTNRLMRQVVEKVIIDQRQGTLEVAWKNQGWTSVVWRWPVED